VLSRLLAALVAGTATAAPAFAAFDDALIAKGAAASAIGNCAVCHTAPGGKPYAGGRALKTPFGTLYGTNITPDMQTGIGLYTEAEFARALREGVDRDGRHLYPAFPYDHFTKLTDDDIKALYAFHMTREPVRAENRPNELWFPFNLRPLIGLWKAFYFEPGRFQGSDRGAYLAEGLAHCGACHTPRNRLGAERKGDAFAGGEAEGWHAPALNSASPSPLPWTEEALHIYLRRGIAEQHALTAGPMADVIGSLSRAPDQDVGAIARYIASLDTRTAEQKSASAAVGTTLPEAASGDTPIARGARIYAGACGECHDRGRQADGGAMRLEFATGLTMPTPRNLIHIIREGIIPPEGERGAWMPAYAGALTDEQITDLVTYLRSTTGKPPWPDVAAEVRRSSRE
jgi:mono/diheme cytochrome c family protein